MEKCMYIRRREESRHKGYTYGGDIYTEGAYSPWENASKLDYAKSSRAWLALSASDQVNVVELFWLGCLAFFIELWLRCILILSARAECYILLKHILPFCYIEIRRLQLPRTFPEMCTCRDGRGNTHSFLASRPNICGSDSRFYRGTSGAFLRESSQSVSSKPLTIGLSHSRVTIYPNNHPNIWRLSACVLCLRVLLDVSVSTKVPCNVTALVTFNDAEVW